MYLAQNGLSLAERQPDDKYKNTWADDKAKLAKATEVFAFYKALIDKGQSTRTEQAGAGRRKTPTFRSTNMRW
jgi:multiple sugar transport system substrate-binding protein